MRTIKFEVLVTNIGIVYTGEDGEKSHNIFRGYVEASKVGQGKATGGDVFLIFNDEIIEEYLSPEMTA